MLWLSWLFLHLLLWWLLSWSWRSWVDSWRLHTCSSFIPFNSYGSYGWCMYKLHGQCEEVCPLWNPCIAKIWTTVIMRLRLFDLLDDVMLEMYSFTFWIRIIEIKFHAFLFSFLKVLFFFTNMISRLLLTFRMIRFFSVIIIE